MIKRTTRVVLIRWLLLVTAVVSLSACSAISNTYNDFVGLFESEEEDDSFRELLGKNEKRYQSPTEGAIAYAIFKSPEHFEVSAYKFWVDPLMKVHAYSSCIEGTQGTEAYMGTVPMTIDNYIGRKKTLLLPADQYAYLEYAMEAGSDSCSVKFRFKPASEHLYRFRLDFNDDGGCDLIGWELSDTVSGFDEHEIETLEIYATESQQKVGEQYWRRCEHWQGPQIDAG